MTESNNFMEELIALDEEILSAADESLSYAQYRKIMNHFKNWEAPKEKVKIPEFVKRALTVFTERYFQDCKSAYLIIKEMYRTSDDEVKNWLNESDENVSKLEKAIIDGYETEHEQLYYVKFWTGKNDGYLNVGVFNGEMITATKETTDAYKTKFTEAEIKAIDERYWQFAEKVEDEK